MTVTIRRVEPDDFEVVRQIYSGPRAVWGTLQLPFPPAEAWRKRLADAATENVGLLACIGEEAVGHINLHTFPSTSRRRHVGQIAMAVRDGWQGQGVGTALMQAALDLADRWLNLSRLELEVYTDNEPALRLYRSCGFELEGTLRHYAFRDGAFADAHAMARLRPAT